jgi:hypothetical protein
MPATRFPLRKARINPMLPPPDPLIVSSGFIGGMKPSPLPPQRPPPLPSEVIEIEESQPESSRRQDLAAFPMPIPLRHEGQGVQTESPGHSPSRKGQGTQTDPQPCKLPSPHFRHSMPCVSCANHSPYIAHHAPHASCMTHAPYIPHASCATYSPYIAHHIPHASCMTHAPYVAHASCSTSQASFADTMKEIVIYGRSLAQMIQEAREDGYREAMEHVAKKMDDEFNWE